MDKLRSLLSRSLARRVVESTTTTKRDDARTIIPFPVPGSGTCSICKGTGYLRANKPYGDPQFGKAVPCKCKIEEVKRHDQEGLIELSGITTLQRFRKASFESFNRGLPHVQEAYRDARQFAADPLGWLVLLGPYGCGKTHLAVAVAKRRLEQGDTVLVQTVPDLLDHLRASFSPHTEQTFDETFQQMRDVDLLILDDYGAEQTTPWAAEKMFQIFNHRYNKSLPTVVTSNNIYLQGIDPRVYSRLCDKDLVKMVVMENARDYRMHGEQYEEED